MASRFLQKYYLPEGFQDILSELVREVLRAQPDDIIEFLAEYCEAKAKGGQLQYPSQYGAPKNEQTEQELQDQLLKQKLAIQEKTRLAKQIVNSSNRQQVSMRPKSREVKKTLMDKLPEPISYKPKQESQQQGPSPTENIPENDKAVGGDEPIDQQIQQQQSTEQQQESEQRDTQSRGKSAKSDGRVSVATTHPEEKGLTRDYIGELYGSALQNLTESKLQLAEQEKKLQEAQGGDKKEGDQNQEQIDFSKEVEENKEEFEKAAQFIQSKYKSLKGDKQGKKEE